MSIGAAEDARPEPNDSIPLSRFLKPLVDWVAGIRATVHTKLLAGFLLISLLLLSMGLLSVVVLSRLNDQVDTLNTLNRQASQARDMIYEVTSQSHFRAMALLKLNDPRATPRRSTTRSRSSPTISPRCVRTAPGARSPSSIMSSE